MKPFYLLCYRFNGQLWLLFSVDEQQQSATPYMFKDKEEALQLFERFRKGLTSLHPACEAYNKLLAELAIEHPATVMCFDQELQNLPAYVEDPTLCNPAHELAPVPHSLVKMKAEFARFKVLDVLQEIAGGTRIVDGELAKFQVRYHPPGQQ